jgi:TAP-like protein
VMDLSDMPACAFWPFATPAPAATHAPLPSVPTLILSGADDLRTPTANAREVAAQIPGAKLLVVPNTGHSVLDSDPTGCSSSALQALFAAKPIKACAPTPLPPLLRPTPVPPALLTDIAPARGNHGRPGRTLAAVLLTLVDFGRQLEVQALAQLGSGGVGALTSLNVGGLRSGWAESTPRRIVLHRYSYVPGVTLSGVITAAGTSFSVGGRAAAHGRLHIGARGTLSGFLDGNRVSVSAAGPGAKAARAAVADPRSAAVARPARRR